MQSPNPRRADARLLACDPPRVVVHIVPAARRCHSEVFIQVPFFPTDIPQRVFVPEWVPVKVQKYAIRVPAQRTVSHTNLRSGTSARKPAAILPIPWRPDQGLPRLMTICHLGRRRPRRLSAPRNSKLSCRPLCHLLGLLMIECHRSPPRVSRCATGSRGSMLGTAIAA